MIKKKKKLKAENHIGSDILHKLGNTGTVAYGDGRGHIARVNIGMFLSCSVAMV